MTDKERYHDRRARKVCVKCEAPALRFATCKICKARHNDLQKERLKFPSVRVRKNASKRQWARKRRDVLGICWCGNELPCLECARRNREYREAQGLGKRVLTCGRCGDPSHIATSLLCPKRFVFEIDVEEYANARQET